MVQVESLVQCKTVCKCLLYVTVSIIHRLMNSGIFSVFAFQSTTSISGLPNYQTQHTADTVNLT